MLHIDRRSLQHFDWVLFGLVGVLLCVGLANLYSATQAGSHAITSGSTWRSTS